jgi:hypothetical protein
MMKERIGHAEPFAVCLPERSEGSAVGTQDKLREASAASG